MKPIDDNARLPVSQRPFRLLIISGSDGGNTICRLCATKSKMAPNKYRAYKHFQPRHLWADVKEGIHYLEMMAVKVP
jgi:hypothetical protein